MQCLRKKTVHNSTKETQDKRQHLLNLAGLHFIESVQTKVIKVIVLEDERWAECSRVKTNPVIFIQRKVKAGKIYLFFLIN